jgi:hypothetical protein
MNSAKHDRGRHVIPRKATANLISSLRDVETQRHSDTTRAREPETTIFSMHRPGGPRHHRKLNHHASDHETAELKEMACFPAV